MSLSAAPGDSELKVIATAGSTESDSGEKPDLTDRYAPLIVRGTIVAAGVAGVVLFARSIRLFSQFQHARQIPSEFIRKQVKLRGTVASVQNDGSLRVEHQPTYRFPRISGLLGLSKTTSDPGRLTLKLAGIEVSEAGCQWLRQNLGSSSTGNSKKVWFTLIKPGSNSDSVDCDVAAKLSRLPIQTSLNQELIRRGLARVPGSDVGDHFKSLTTVPAYSRLVNQLLISEQIADRRGVGMWHRDTWVESLRAYPSQVKEVVRYSTPVRFAMVVGQGTRDVVVNGWVAGKTAVNFGLNTGKTLYDAGRKTVNFVQGVYGKISGFVKKIRN